METCSTARGHLSLRSSPGWIKQLLETPRCAAGCRVGVWSPLLGRTWAGEPAPRQKKASDIEKHLHGKQHPTFVPTSSDGGAKKKKISRLGPGALADHEGDVP